MARHFPRRQRGLSFFTLVLLLVLLGGLGLIAMQVLPTALEYQAALKAINKAREGNTVPEVRAIFDRAAQIDDIKSITGRDLEVTKNGDQVIVSFAYNKELHLFGPAYLLLKYQGQSRAGR